VRTRCLLGAQSICNSTVDVAPNRPWRAALGLQRRGTQRSETRAASRRRRLLKRVWKVLTTSIAPGRPTPSADCQTNGLRALRIAAQGNYPWASSTRGERPDMLAVDQFDTDRAEPIEVVIPGGLPSMGGVDAREDGYPSTEVLFKATVAASETYNTATSGPSANHNRTHS
jgi:hypothetical protein